jgi:hypothetical protein
MSAALVTDGADSFVVLLVVLLAMMLFAVIRAPGWDGRSAEDAEEGADRPLPSVPVSSRPVPVPFRPADARTGTADVQARAALVIARAAAVLPGTRVPEPEGAAAMPVSPVAVGQHRYPAEQLAGTLPRPEVSSGPPWGPAPKPSGI